MKNNVLDFFRETVDKNGEKIAVVHNEKSITFLELQKKSNVLGSKIFETLSQKINGIVAVYLPKSINAVIADLAVSVSGNAFMNLDVLLPSARTKNILDLIKPRLIISDNVHLKNLESFDIPVIDISSFDFLQKFDADTLIETRKKMIDTDPFCIINTSGSTGTPKGVALCHRSFFDFMEWAIETFSLTGNEVLGSLSPIVFDIWDFELCLMIFCGSRMALLDASLAAFPARLLAEVENKKVSFVFWVPSIMVNIANLDLLKTYKLPDLRLVWFAGEVFPTKQFLYWYDKLLDVTFANLYGPIEITLDCTYYIVKTRPNENEPLPIGLPCKNTDILILNDKNELCKTGEIGELCVRGTSLAHGYYNNPEKTASAFVQNPLNSSYPETIYKTGDLAFRDENGLIHYKGRNDSLIKHSGYRIELGEIEHVLVNQLKMVKYCCAVYDYAKKQIVLFYESPTEISASDFKKQLETVFPRYMIPQKFVQSDLLPRNTNGKIDRLKLKESVNS